ncbi:hypothetical protein PVK06_040451 [Gossypium arboreum]|uniref:Uncharacterized protein n=1 Tax=Gossypium arboreum TaxID=29729 RepID=A0ABR0N7M9_GOSAR|nr:hypothetical protein PVK06_040451 [Gossypium arboreum]
MERKTIELDQGWDYMHKGIKKLRRILEGLPEPPFTSEEYMMLYTYPSKKTEAVMKNEEQTRFLFGISLSDRPKWKQFLICSSGFFFGYLVNGICEVLPVMAMGAFIPGLRRKYPAHEYVSAILLVLGLILFTLADAQTLPSFSVIGVIMVISALVMDSFLGNLQEAIFNMNPETTQIEMLFCSTVVGLPLLIPPMVLTGEVFEAWNSVLSGTAVSMVMKYADNIVKVYSTSVAMLLTAVVSVFLFGFNLTLAFFLGATQVIEIPFNNFLYCWNKS